MIRKKREIIILLIVVILVSFFLLFNDILLGDKSKHIYKVSAIVRGENTESWAIVKQGIDQAALEMNVDVSFITLSEENSFNEQIELLNREINNGAEAILISPADYDEMVEEIENVASKVPVVLIESTINTDKKIPYISCDNYKLGKVLAEELIQMGNTRSKIAVIESGLGCSSIKERYNGFLDTIKTTKNTCTFLDLPLEGKSVYNQSKELIEKNIYDVIVTFDAVTLEVFAQVKKDSYKENIEIYGIGSTSKILSLLEEKIINSTAVQSEFNIGYLGMKAAVDMLTGKKVADSVIESTVVSVRNMYSEENQRLLFPFIR
ncbi:MAG: substrate-binding domain-containing protein [Clostridium sp.]